MIIPAMPVPFARYSSPLMERRPKPLLLFPLVYEHDTLFTSMQNYVCGPRTILSHPSPLAFSFGARQCGTRAGDWRWLSRTRTGYWRAPTNSLARVAAISKCFGVKRRGRWPAKIWNSRWKRWIPRVSLSP